jgi:hypothetical protein
MESIWSGLESAFSSVGLGSPLARGVAGVAIGGIGEFVLKPSYSYTKDGSPRPWAFLKPDQPDATYLPPGSTAVITGFVLAFFV